MIVTTTQSVEGYRITGYYGIVFGEVVTGVNFLRDIGAWSPQAAPPSPWKRRSNENEGSTDNRTPCFSSRPRRFR